MHHSRRIDPTHLRQSRHARHQSRRSYRSQKLPPSKLQTHLSLPLVKPIFRTTNYINLPIPYALKSAAIQEDSHRKPHFRALVTHGFAVKQYAATASVSLSQRKYKDTAPYVEGTGSAE